jgi:misacylated tRNA(Ala) deacylase
VTEKLYLVDATIQQFDAVVLAINEDQIELDKTAFYVTGGGQPHDTGLLRWQNGESSVEEVRMTDGRVWHRLNGDIPDVGVSVTGLIDQERRQHMMRTHTAMHILCGVMWQKWQRVVTGGNMDAVLDRDLIRTKVNLIPDSVTDIRVVDIVGLDKQADGGTHVAFTGEVGRIEITKTESKGRGFKRIRFVLHDS